MSDLNQMIVQLRRRDALHQYACQEYVLRKLHEDHAWHICALKIMQRLEQKFKFS